VEFHITEHPTAHWTAQQAVEAFPWETAPRFLLRDRDGVYGLDFRRRVQSRGIEEVVIAARSPYPEQAVGWLESWAPSTTLKYGELMSQSEDREVQGDLGAKHGDQGNDQGDEDRPHGGHSSCAVAVGQRHRPFCS
jgi:hypothetical protein